MKNLNTLLVGILIYLLVTLSLNQIQEAYAEIQQVEVTNPVTIKTPPVPTAPDNLTISGITESSAIISWSPVSVASGYSIWINDTRWAAAESPSAEIRALKPDTTYIVHLTAINGGGESNKSNSIAFTTLPPVPTAVVNPTVSSVTGDSAIIHWEPLPPWQCINVYRVYVDGVAIADVEPQTGLQAANLTNLSAGDHSVFISGVNNNREGPASTPAQFTIQVLPAITGFKMINHSADTIYLCWDAVTNASQYTISSNGQPAGATSQTSYALSGLDPDQNYQVTVTSVMPDGNQTQAATLDVNTLPIASYTKDKLMKAIYTYIPDMMPGAISVFVVGIAFGLARFAKITVGNNRFFRYWR